jgi:NADH:ubiquinone oxidoreductase subunit K
MNNINVEQIRMYLLFVTLIATIGIYYMIATRNLIRILIGLELISKSVTLLFASAGYFTNNTGLAQTFIISIIVVEVVVIAVGAGIIISVFKKYGTLETKNIKKLKG